MDATRTAPRRGKIRRLVRSAVRPERRASTVAGLLLLLGIAAGLRSVVPVLEEPDYLRWLPEREAEVVSGALFQALMIPGYAGFALVLHPTLRRASPGLAGGFVGFRLMACGFHLLGVAMLPLFLDLGRGYDVAADPASYEVVAETLRRGRDLVNHVGVIIAVGLADLLLFSILYRWRLVPTWLSVWGLAGVALAVLASLLLLSDVVEVVGLPYLALNGPLALHTLALAGWLVARGLDARALPAA